MMRRRLAGLAIVMGSAAIFVVVAQFGVGRREAHETPPPPVELIAQRPDPKTTAPAIKLTSEEFRRQGHSAEFIDRWRDKVIEVSGVVEGFNRSQEYQGDFVFLEGGWGSAPYFRLRDSEPWSVVYLNQRVVVRGYLEDPPLGVPGLSIAVIVEKGPINVVKSTAEHLTREYLLDAEAAGEKYDGKCVVIEGFVAEINGNQSVEVVLDGHDSTRVHCATMHPNLSRMLFRGRKVQMIGKCVGVSSLEGDSLAVNVRDAFPITNQLIEMPKEEPGPPIPKSRIPPTEAESAGAISALRAMGIKVDDGLLSHTCSLEKERFEADGSIRSDVLALLGCIRHLHEVHCFNDETDETLKSLSTLNELHHVFVYPTRCTNAGLAFLGRCTSLRYLEIGFLGGPRGAIDDGGLEFLKGLRNLYWLEVHGSPITDAGFRNLKSLRKLEILSLDATKATGAGFSELAGLKSLKTVELTRNDVSEAGVKAIASLLTVREIKFVGCRIAEGALRSIAASKATRLDLTGSAITDDDLDVLKAMSQLTWLRLDYAHCTDSGLKRLQGLTRLENLALNHCREIGDEGVKHLERLPALKTLGLEGCGKVTEEGVNRLRSANPKLRVLTDKRRSKSE